MATPEQWALGKLDGRNADTNQPEPWRIVQLYRRVTGTGQRTKARPESGKQWTTSSILDEITVLSEDLTVVYVDGDGKEWTVGDMIVAIFQYIQAQKKET